MIAANIDDTDTKLLKHVEICTKLDGKIEALYHKIKVLRMSQQYHLTIVEDLLKEKEKAAAASQDLKS